MASFSLIFHFRTFKEVSAVEEQLSLCRELCEDLANDLKKEGLKVVSEDCTLLCVYICYWMSFCNY